MARKLDKLIVIDVEATCWNQNDAKSQENEIIEIGVCVVNLSTLSIESNEGIFVIPKNSTVSPFCTELTGITQEMIDNNGIPFQEACSILRDTYNTPNRTWASWGDYDRRQFEKQCNRYDVKYPFGPTHLNVKNLFAIAKNISREVGMDKALKMYDMTLEGTHHRGVDDAKNIAKIVCELLK